MTREELARRLESGEDLLLVMTLGAFDYQVKHIPGSIRANSPQELLELPHDKPIVLYGAHEACPQAIQAHRFLLSHGYRDVRRSPGGIVEWEQAGLPLAAGVLEPR